MTSPRQHLTAEEIETIKARCPSLKEPLTFTPALAACLENWKRTDEQRKARDDDKLYRNATRSILPDEAIPPEF